MLLADLMMSSYNKIISATLQYNTVNASNLSGYSFPTATIGPAPSQGQRRFLVIVIATNDGDNLSVFNDVSVTVDAVVATPAIYTNDTTIYLGASGIYWIEKPTGTTSNIYVDITGSNNVRGLGINVHSVITGLKGLQVEDTGFAKDGTDPTVSLNITRPSFVVGGIGAINGGPFTFSQGTLHTSTDIESNDWVCLMSDNVAVPTNPYTVIADDGGDPGDNGGFSLAAFSAKQT